MTRAMPHARAAEAEGLAKTVTARASRHEGCVWWRRWASLRGASRRNPCASPSVGTCSSWPGECMQPFLLICTQLSAGSTGNAYRD